MMKTLITVLFEKLFPPKMGKVREPYAFPLICADGYDSVIDEQGSCGRAKPKQYKDAIDRIAKTGEL